MNRIALLLMLSIATAMAQTPSTKRQKSTGADSAIDAQAQAALARMTNFLRTLKTFTINSESTRDEVVDTNMKVQKNASSEITVRLPDRLHARAHGDEHDREFFYDGQTLTVFDSENNYYGSTPAPPTVSRTLDAVRARYNIVLPLTDFIQMAAAEDFLQDITAAGYIGTSRIDGVECDHVAIRQADVDWQVWIEKSDTPLPRKLVITTRKEATQPQYSARMTWNLSPQLDNDLFTFTPPPDAVRIKFARARDGGKAPAGR